MEDRGDGEEFRHPETAAHRRSLTEAEARRHGPVIREDGDVFLEYRIEGGHVRCRRVAAGDMPREPSGCLLPARAPKLTGGCLKRRMTLLTRRPARSAGAR